jgi:hypothetical protein
MNELTTFEKLLRSQEKQTQEVYKFMWPFCFILILFACFGLYKELFPSDYFVPCPSGLVPHSEGLKDSNGLWKLNTTNGDTYFCTAKETEKGPPSPGNCVRVPEMGGSTH